MNRLREYREQRMLTQRELADRAKVSVRTVRSVEAGRPCRLSTQARILQALGLTHLDRSRVFPPADDVT